MKNFTMNRFTRVVCYDFRTQRRNLVICIVGMLLAYLLCFLTANMSCNDFPDDERMKIIVNQALGTSMLATLIYIFAITGSLFGPEQGREGRTALLMLPATNLEKFLSRWLYVAVVTALGMAMFAVVDGVHMLYHWAAGDEVVSALALYARDLPYTAAHSESQPVATLGILVAIVMRTGIYAFFLLGGVLFRMKHAYIPTGMLLIAAGLVYIALFKVFRVHLSEMHLLCFFLVAGLVATVGFTWLAYRLFCRWQLVTRKYLSV